MFLRRGPPPGVALAPACRTGQISIGRALCRRDQEEARAVALSSDRATVRVRSVGRGRGSGIGRASVEASAIDPEELAIGRRNYLVTRIGRASWTDQVSATDRVLETVRESIARRSISAIARSPATST